MSARYLNGSQGVPGDAGARGLPGFAEWTGLRYYALDAVAGNDANLGFSDVSMADAGTVAKKTVAGLQAVIPSSGQGQSLVIAIKGGADIAQALRLWFGEGYVAVHIVMTTDWTDTYTDRLLSGAQIFLAGPNGDSSFSVAAGATTTAIPVTGGGLPTDRTLTLKRIRFEDGTTSAVRTNTAGTIQLNDVHVAGAPVAGTKFWIERPTCFTTVFISHASPLVMRGVGASSAGAVDTFVVSGPSPGSETDTGVTAGLHFCGSTGLLGTTRVYNEPFAYCRGNYVPIVGDNQVVDTGVGLVTANSLEMVGNVWTVMHDSGFGLLGVSDSSIRSCPTFVFADGCVGRAGMRVLACGRGGTIAGQLTLRGFVLGNQDAANTRRPLLLDPVGESAAVQIWESNVSINGLELQVSQAAKHGIVLIGQGLSLTIENLSGSVSRSILDLYSQIGWEARNCIIDVNEATVTCTPDGDAGGYPGIHEYLGAYWFFTDLARTNLVDSAGNNIIGTVGTKVLPGQVRMCLSNASAIGAGEGVSAEGTFYGELPRVKRAINGGVPDFMGVALTAVPGVDWPVYVAFAGAPVTLFASAPGIGKLVAMPNATAGVLESAGGGTKVGRIVSNYTNPAGGVYYAQVSLGLT